jgi:hypothetical protein
VKRHNWPLRYMSGFSRKVEPSVYISIPEIASKAVALKFGRYFGLESSSYAPKMATLIRLWNFNLESVRKRDKWNLGPCFLNSDEKVSFLNAMRCSKCLCIRDSSKIARPTWCTRNLPMETENTLELLEFKWDWEAKSAYLCTRVNSRQ